ncbi:sterol desaturase family protein [Noviherbaspirillum galbum]|uniref:Sterol desaturase family protein n=1 Tax=Noviherbaspirillum galbum TaxID=2709383 RepID=A0A6B3SL29_9BURK|nr:sterol desaturase family protein [Noviherbaspirillum galbum]NEX61480.1 sterol desaturase family protein [Noviherbaspirillum galbum]
MQEKVITLATPVFFLLIFIEFFVGLARRRNNYRINDAINSLSLGVLSQVAGVFLRVVRIGIYAWLVQHVAIFKLPANSVWVWISGLLLYDLCYYWLHRMGHEVNVLWAAHVVHHQSEEYNLTTALRQTSSGAILGWIFYVPMAVLGYPVEVFAAVALIDLLYQFWVHTEQVGKLGWLDRVLVTPSNHRVHHAVNDVYLDKNYGGILILWDRLFSTFIEESDHEPVVYGTRSPLRSWNPVWANLEVYKGMCQDSWRAARWPDKLRVWIARPGWHPADVAAKWPAKAFDITHERYDPKLSRAEQLYSLAQFTLMLLVTTHFLSAVLRLPLPQQLAYAGWIGGGLWIIGGLLERRPVYLGLEVLRLAGTAVGVAVAGAWFGGVALPLAAQVMIAVFAAGSVLGLWLAYRPSSAAHGYLSAQ